MTERDRAETIISFAYCGIISPRERVFLSLKLTGDDDFFSAVLSRLKFVYEKASDVSEKARELILCLYPETGDRDRI